MESNSGNRSARGFWLIIHSFMQSSGVWLLFRGLRQGNQ
jgi:hypothetical protein